MMNGRSVIIVCMTYFIFSCAKQTIDINAAKVSALNNENLVTSNEITSHFFFTDIDIGLMIQSMLHQFVMVWKILSG